MLKMIKRGIMALVIIVIATMGTSVFAEEKSLTHYEPYSSWAKDVGFKYNLIFLEKPQRSALRWEIVNLLDSVSDVEESSNVKSRIEFTDLQEVSEDVRQKIIKATENGYISGYADKTFKPFNEVSRGEFVALLDRFGMLEKSKKKSNKTFIDVDEHWSKDYVYKAVANGIISGKSESDFCPDDTITLEEILIILDRMESNGKMESSNIISAVLGTFYARQYDESEKFKVEDIYGEMEQIQHDMWVYRNSLLGYDYSDISRKITLEDALIWRYYYDSGFTHVNRLRLNDANKDKYFRSIIIDHIQGTNQDNYFFGIIPEEPIPYDRSVTVKEFLHALLSGFKEGIEDVDVKFSNFSTFSDEEKKDVKRAVYFELIPNSTNEFPINDYMTCALLNYITVKRNHCKPLYKGEPLDMFTDAYYFNEAVNSEEGTYYTEMDHNTWPSNYEQYPFIMRPFPNEAYEIPFIGSEAPLSKTPVEFFKETVMPLESKATNYINTVVNVDYTTIDAQTLSNVVSGLCCYSYSADLLEPYVQYVKDHKIKLEGSCYSCKPIFYYDGSGFGRSRMRFYVKFKVINSDTNMNLLLGDDGIFIDVSNNIEYAGDEFEFYIDFQFVRTATSNYEIEGLEPLIYDITLQKVGQITRW